MGQDEYAIPWDKLEYDPGQGGYRTNITEAQLQDAPASDFALNDRGREEELHDYFGVAYYWDE